MSRSSKPPVVVIQMIRPVNGGKPFPTYLALGQRHFEKEVPAGEKLGAYGHEGVSYIIPLDMLRVYNISPELIEEVEEVRVVYKARG